MADRMRTPPPNVLVLPAGDSTVFLGPPSAWDMNGLGSFTVVSQPIDGFGGRDARHALETLRGDHWQVSKLRNYLASPHLTNYSVQTSLQDTTHVFDILYHRLRSHSLIAIVTRNHDRHAVPSSARHGAAKARQACTHACSCPTVTYRRFCQYESADRPNFR